MMLCCIVEDTTQVFVGNVHGVEFEIGEPFQTRYGPGKGRYGADRRHYENDEFRGHLEQPCQHSRHLLLTLIVPVTHFDGPQDLRDRVIKEKGVSDRVVDSSAQTAKRSTSA